MAVHRNRVIYQSEALFISPDATGYHYTGANGETELANGSKLNGSFGLMTPPINARQVVGGKNNKGQAAGWLCGDTWPTWTPDGEPILKAKFDNTVDVDSTTINVTVTAKVFDGLQINFTSQAGQTDTLGQKFPAADFDVAGDPANDSRLLDAIIDNNVQITSNNAVAHTASSRVVQDITFTAVLDNTSSTSGTDGDNISIELADTLANPGDPVTVDVTGTDIVINISAGNTLQSAIVNAIAASVDASALVVAVAGNPGNNSPANAALNLQGGVDGTAASVVVAQLAVDDRTVGPIKLEASNVGVIGNTITLTGTAARDDIDALVATHNAANPNNTIDAGSVEGGSLVLDTGQTITLSGGSEGTPKDHGSIVKQLKRVQSANYGFTINRQDVNQFGHASRLDSVVVESPTVNLDFSYYLLDGFNERQLEFVTNGSVNTLSGMLTPELYQAGNNFFILTAPEARDAVRGDVNLNEQGLEDTKSVISLGNGYITDYSVDISVGSIPTVNVTVEGMNIRSDFGTTGNDVPAMNMRDGSRVSDAWGAKNDRTACYDDGCTGLYSLPAAKSGYTGCKDDIAALRPGDVVVDLQGKSLISKSTSGDGSSPVVGSAHIQSANISLPLARTSLQRLGSVFGFSKAIDLPLSVTVSVNALLSDLKRGNMVDLLCDCEEFEVSISLFKPDCNGCITKQTDLAMKYTMKGARLESENFSSTIGDNKSVDLTFTTQIGSSDDMVRGLYISGMEAGSSETNKGIAGFPPAWTGIGGQTTGAADGYLFGYRE